jgi:hypothetical protein
MKISLLDLTFSFRGIMIAKPVVDAALFQTSYATIKKGIKLPRDAESRITRIPTHPKIIHKAGR